MSEFRLTERTTVCGRCHHSIARPGTSLGHASVDSPCRSAPRDESGRVWPCDCPAVEANRWQEMGDEQRARLIMEHARGRA